MASSLFHNAKFRTDLSQVPLIISLAFQIFVTLNGSLGYLQTYREQLTES